jgi:hypothetical protein
VSPTVPLPGVSFTSRYHKPNTYGPERSPSTPPVPGAQLVEPVRTVSAAERLPARLEQSDDRPRW